MEWDDLCVFRATVAPYDVALGQSKPYEVPVRFARGASSTTLSGSVAYNFGDEYIFEARAGQRAMIELAKYTGRRPGISQSNRFYRRFTMHASMGPPRTRR